MPISPARRVAFDILRKVQQGGYASDLLLRATQNLEEADAALAHALVFGCLRFAGQLDFLMRHYAHRRHLKVHSDVRLALHMGIFQMRYLSRIPNHAAVMESVELTKRAHQRSATGFVNAVLRNVNRKETRFPDLATELSLPAWLLERWVARYGESDARNAAAQALTEPAKHRRNGRFQDIGAQSIVPLLELKPGEFLLDLCAAPGNKTAQAQEAGARIIACDRHRHRLAEMRELNVPLVALDGTKPLPFASQFDKILVDAPCSGTGTLARNPEIKWRLQPEDLATFPPRQGALIHHAFEVLRPGGRLVYATCSLEPEENEQVVDAFLATQADARLASTHLRLPGREPGDGFFAAVLDKA